MLYVCAISFWLSVSTLVKVMTFGRESWEERVSYRGAMALHGPHQSAQKSVTTIREDWRTWVKCWGEEMLMIFDMVELCVRVVKLLYVVDGSVGMDWVAKACAFFQ